MKKICFVLGLILLLNSSSSVYARCHGHYHYCSTPVYVVRSDYFENEGSFANCNEHYFLTKTTINHYSNGTRRTFNNYTVLDKNETIILTDCTDLKHMVYNKKHYFLVRKGGVYQIYDAKGNLKTIRNYSKMADVEPNRILVKYDKKYGIIDLEENIIVPMKYKSFEKINKNLYLTKLNGYWGMTDSSNKTILPNEYDKIKRLYDTYKLKKEGLFGLADINGKIIVSADSDSIKKLGEYILVKKGKAYRVFDATGKELNNTIYKKVRLERNVLEGKLIDNTWVKIGGETL